MSEHAVIAPSGLSLTVACNASLQLQASVPPLPDTDDQAEGDAGHWVARRYAAGYGHELPIGAKFPCKGREWTVDADMYAGARLYARALGYEHHNLRLERRVKIKRVHPTECEGTPDGYRVFYDAREAHPNGCPEGLPDEAFNAGRLKLIRVGDYKYGHRFVEVFENYQLSAYASGVADEHGLDDNDENIYVELILVQPRCYHRDGPVRIWRTKLVNLRAVINIASNAAHAALVPLTEYNAPKATTGAHCVDCSARHVCRALQVNTSHLIDYAHTAERVELPAWAVGQELFLVQDAIKRLTARETGLSAQADSMIRAGQPVPMYHMEPQQTRLTYYDNVNTDEIVGLGDMMGIELRKKLERKDQVVTPTQALQLGIDADVMRSYAHRPTGAMRLTRDNSINARKVFVK
jgi:Protein of unknown function (DUF2800)